jgi:hypothetical protein
VAEIAAWLALRIERAGGRGRSGGSGRGLSGGSGRGLDRRLVEAAALLHDVDKALPGAARDKAGHGLAGAAWLAERGYPELAEAVALHPVTLLVDDDGAARLRAASTEARIVAYADKRAGQRLEPMAERFARWERRHPHRQGDGGWSPEARGAARRHALALEVEVCAVAGCRPAEVGRLRWTGRAIARARATRPDSIADPR